MKRILVILLSTLLIVLFAVSCRDSSSGHRTSLSVRIEDDTLSRTIMPNSSLMTTQKYSLSGSGPSGASFGPIVCSDSTVSISDIAVGVWQITAKALNAENNELANGTTTLNVKKGKNEGTIVLDTVPGYGTLQLDFEWDSDLSISSSFTISVSIEDSAGNVISKTKTVQTSDLKGTMIINLSAGSHVLSVRVQGLDGVGATEALRIVSNTRSTGTVKLKRSDSNSAATGEKSTITIDNQIGSPMGFYIDYYPKNPVNKQVMTLKSCIADIPANVDKSSLTYQWYKDGVPQSDGVGCNYIIVTESGAHRYDVIVRSNVEGTMSSASVVLNISD